MVKTPEVDKLFRAFINRNENNVQWLFGKDHDLFVHLKVKWLWKYLTENSQHISMNKRYQLLDYGCGTGEMLKWLQVFGFPGKLHGADISHTMLEEAKKRWDKTSRPLFSCIGETKTNYADEFFSCIVVTCVFHHITPDKRDAVLAEIKRILIPGGVIVIFEHNPLNPLTCLVVKRAAVDKNAKLLYPKEIMKRLHKAAFADCFFKYITFFPPQVNFLNNLEKYLSWCPLGAQYVSVARKA